MNTQKNYGSYHLHELERALANINEQDNPEEARLIREYIAKGGYQYPAHLTARAVFTSAPFKWTLVAVLSFLLLANLVSLLTGALIALIPIAIQGILLFMIFTRHKNIGAMLKIWTSFITLAGAFLFYLTLQDPYYTAFEAATRLILPAISLTLLILSSRYIGLTSDEDTSSSGA